MTFAMQSVLSSSIAFIGYDKETKTLRVQFNSRAIYDYADVPEDVWEAFLDSQSKGSFFLSVIKPKYSFTCVKPRMTHLEESDAEKTEESTPSDKKTPKRTVGVKRIS